VADEVRETVTTLHDPTKGPAHCPGALDRQKTGWEEEAWVVGGGLCRNPNDAVLGDLVSWRWLWVLLCCNPTAFTCACKARQCSIVLRLFRPFRGLP
jgi:hypothetical protein